MEGIFNLLEPVYQQIGDNTLVETRYSLTPRYNYKKTNGINEGINRLYV